MQRVAMLAFEQDVAVIENRQDDCRAGMDDVFACRFTSIRQAHAILFDVQQTTLIFVAGIQGMFSEIKLGHGCAWSISGSSAREYSCPARRWPGEAAPR
jgi:hypothetical protein